MPDVAKSSRGRKSCPVHFFHEEDGRLERRALVCAMQFFQSSVVKCFCAGAGHGDGVHILTGPIYVCGADAGDVLQVNST